MSRAIRTPSVLLDPEYMQKAADELVSKARLCKVGMDEFTACEKMLYSILSDSPEFMAMVNGQFNMEGYNRDGSWI